MDKELGRELLRERFGLDPFVDYDYRRERERLRRLARAVEDYAEQPDMPAPWAGGLRDVVAELREVAR